MPREGEVPPEEGGPPVGLVPPGGVPPGAVPPGGQVPPAQVPPGGAPPVQVPNSLPRTGEGLPPFGLVSLLLGGVAVAVGLRARRSRK
jgi:hypothetical protein